MKPFLSRIEETSEFRRKIHDRVDHLLHLSYESDDAYQGSTEAQE